MIQKLIQVGNSTAVIIPKKVLQQLELSVGDEIELTKQGEKSLLVNPKGYVSASEITPEFKKWLDEFLNENSKTLSELAKN